jgi:hypothetical protein
MKVVWLAALAIATPVYAQDAPYSRGDYKHWSDLNNDCQDTRQEMLVKDSTTAVILTENGCRVVSGTWVGPYTGKIFKLPDQVHIDHVVPLANANKSGAYWWSSSKKELFANDESNLLVTDAAENIRKSDKSPDEYMPRVGGCSFLRKWLLVKAKWSLRMSTEESATVFGKLMLCERR